MNLPTIHNRHLLAQLISRSSPPEPTLLVRWLSTLSGEGARSVQLEEVESEAWLAEAVNALPLVADQLRRELGAFVHGLAPVHGYVEAISDPYVRQEREELSRELIDQRTEIELALCAARALVPEYRAVADTLHGVESRLATATQLLDSDARSSRMAFVHLRSLLEEDEARDRLPWWDVVAEAASELQRETAGMPVEEFLAAAANWHPAYERLVDFAAGDLAAESMAFVATHVKRCTRCAEELTEIASMLAEGDEIAGRVAAEIEAERASSLLDRCRQFLEQLRPLVCPLPAAAPLGAHMKDVGSRLRRPSTKLLFEQPDGLKLVSEERRLALRVPKGHTVIATTVTIDGKPLKPELAQPSPNACDLVLPNTLVSGVLLLSVEIDGHPFTLPEISLEPADELEH
jgi:hypothetical protein